MPDPPPSDVSFLLGSPRAAISLRLLVPVWVWLLACESISRIDGAAGWLLVGAAIVAGGYLCAAWGSLQVVKKASGGGGESIGDLLRALRRSLPVLLSSVLFTFCTPLLFCLSALCVSLAGRTPVVGRWLLAAWIATGGLALALLSAAWILVGLPAAVLQATAAVAEHPDAMDVVSRTLSYVRRRPLWLFLGWLGVFAAAALGTCAFTALVAIALAVVHAMGAVGAGAFPEPRATLEWLRAVWMDGCPGGWIAPVQGASGPHGDVPWIAAALVRLVPAFFAASVFCGNARLYLLVRKWIDGVPLNGSHVRGSAP